MKSSRDPDPNVIPDDDAPKLPRKALVQSLLAHGVLALLVVVGMWRSKDDSRPIQVEMWAPGDSPNAGQPESAPSEPAPPKPAPKPEPQPEPKPEPPAPPPPPPPPP
ncbi:hypothetical protein AAV32_16910, partial [Kerstersia gyiorum]